MVLQINDMKINVGFTNKLQYRKMTGDLCKTLNFEATVLHPIYVAMSGFIKVNFDGITHRCRCRGISLVIKYIQLLTYVEVDMECY